MTILIVLTLWCLLSVPFALLLGAVLGRLDDKDFRR